MSDEDKSAFAYIDRYPEAKVFFTSVSEELADYFEKSLIVLDSSVLILPFDAESTSLNEIGEIYASLKEKDRLFIPAHAIREYMVLREDKVRDLHQRLIKLESQEYVKSTFPILSDDLQYENFIDLQNSLQNFYSKIKQLIGKLEKKVGDWRWNDPVTQLYSKIFDENIIFDPQIERSILEDDFNRRLNLKISPSYKYEGEGYNAAGDLIIWHTILRLAEEKKRSIVFVTSDTGNKWWAQNDDSTHPSFEILQEFKQYSENNPIFFMKFPELLTMMGVQPSVIRDISGITEKDNPVKRIDMPNRIMTLSKDRVEVYHLHTTTVDVHFRSANDIAGKIVKLNLGIFPEEAQDWNYIELITKELDFSEIEPGDYSLSRKIVIHAPRTPGHRRNDSYAALTDLYSITASINGQNIGSDTIIIEEKLLDIKCSISPNEFIVDSFSEINFTLQVKMIPPPEEILQITLSSPVAGTGLAIEHQTSDTRMEGGVLKADVKMKLGGFPDFFFENESVRGDTYIVEIGDAFGYRKPFYWNTTVGINLGPFRKL